MLSRMNIIHSKNMAHECLGGTACSGNMRQVPKAFEYLFNWEGPQIMNIFKDTIGDLLFTVFKRALSIAQKLIPMR